MRSDASQFALSAPPTLADVLSQLAAAPGRYAPLAGGTEVMVALGAGRLRQREFVSIQHLREIRFIRAHEDAIEIGAGTTFTDIRRDAMVAEELPLLAQAAAWTGSIANQNRGTLGGNLCNASPAADSPPALLAYDAVVTLISVRGERTVPYRDFHLGYKKTALAPDELLHSVRISRPATGVRQYIRKVGPRNAQAISKVALACVASAAQGHITDVKIGAASLADRPLRCYTTETVLRGSEVTEDIIRSARATLIAEASPIDDIRSTAHYRSVVAANLLEEFLRTLA